MDWRDDPYIGKKNKTPVYSMEWKIIFSEDFTVIVEGDWNQRITIDGDLI